MISIVLLSCKKENHSQTTAQNKLYPVSFSVSGFDQQIDPIDQKNKTKINAAVIPDSSAVKRLIYRVYDSSNILKKTITINKGEPRFGTFKDSLAAGNYTAVFVGVENVSNFRDDGSKFYYIDINSTKTYPTETFYKKVNFVVGNQYLQQNVVLQRINSQLQLIIQDAIPSDIKEIDISITGINMSYSYFDAVSSDTTYQTVSATVSSDKIGTKNFSLMSLPNLLNTSSKVTVSITARGLFNATAFRKTINNVTLLPNKLTVLTGNLFTADDNPNGFAINFNTVYNPGIEQSY